MDALLQSPAAVGAIGLLLITMAAIPFSQTRSRGSLALLVAAVLLTAGGLAVERLYLTPREQVHAAVSALFDAIVANDLPRALAQIDPAAADVRADAETLMPRFRVESASLGGEVRVELPTDPAAEGSVATASLKPLIRVQHSASGTIGAYFDTLELDLVRRGDRWRLQAYRPAQDWREGANRLGR